MSKTSYLGAAFFKCEHTSYWNVALTQLLDIESVPELHVSMTWSAFLLPFMQVDDTDASTFMVIRAEDWKCSKTSPQGPLHINTRLPQKQTWAGSHEVQWLFRSARGRIRGPRGSEEPEIPSSEWKDDSGEVVAGWLLRGQMNRLGKKNEMTIPGVTFQLRQINNEGDHRSLGGDAQTRRSPGRVWEDWQPASNTPQPPTAVLELLLHVLQSRRRLATWLTFYQHSVVMIALLVIFTPPGARFS